MRMPAASGSRKSPGWWLCYLVLMAGPGRAAEVPPRSLLLITIDTLRADHLSCNGAGNVTTPNLDRLARAGVNFTRARAQAPLTLPSHASILTGVYPPAHGIRDNGSSRLSESQTTLGEVLRSRGYETAAFIGSFVLDRRFGLAQGFDLYDDEVSTTPESLESFEAERNAEAVANSFETWLSTEERQGPFFAWLHFYDPHAPYAPPEPFASRFRTDPYAGEVAYVDDVIGRVLARLEADDLVERMVVAVAGDHGEGLGEHGEQTHSLLIYNSTLHVPMILHAPGLIEPGASVASLVRTIDLAPTLLEALGVEQELGEGRSLMPMITRAGGGSEGGSEAGRLSYSESLYAQINLGWSAVRGVESETHHLILGPRPELYDPVSDPEELRDLAGSRPEVVEELIERFEELGLSTGPAKPRSEAPGMDPEVVEQLRSLGYLSGAASAPVGSGDERSISPRDMVGVWQQIEIGLRLYAQGEFAGAARQFEAVLEVHPETSLLYEYLGSCYQRSGENEAADRVYRQALDRGLESSELHLGLARSAMARGDDRRAETELSTAIELDPLSVVGLQTLGDLYRSRRDYTRAVGQYRAALEINPSYVYAWNGLGMSLGALGDEPAALAAFQRAVQVAPNSPQPYMNLAVQLERMGRIDDARSAYAEFLVRSQDLPELARERSLAEAALERLGS